MKKIVLSLALSASLVMASESILGEFGTPEEYKAISGVTLDAGIWYMSWNQTSTSSEMVNDPTKVLDVS